MKKTIAPRARSENASARVGPLMAIPALLREFGVEPSRLLARAGLDRHSFDDPENRRPFAALARLAAECVTATGCAHFGLLIGQPSGELALGALGESMRQANSVRAALRQLILQFHLQDTGGVPVLNDLGGGEVALGYVVHHPETPALAQVHDVAIAVAFKLLRETTLPIGDIATALRYADPSSFCRAFRSWSGTAPGNWRRQAIGAAAA